MPPLTIARDRATLRRLLRAERLGTWAASALLIGAATSILLLIGLGHVSDGSPCIGMLGLGLITIGFAARSISRSIELHTIAVRLSQLVARPDLIVWIYEQRHGHGSRTTSNIYVCSRRGERLHLTVRGARRDQAIALLERLAPDAPRGFSRARDAAFERDPLSVAGEPVPRLSSPDLVTTGA